MNIIIVLSEDVAEFLPLMPREVLKGLMRMYAREERYEEAAMVRDALSRKQGTENAYLN